MDKNARPKPGAKETLPTSLPTQPQPKPVEKGKDQKKKPSEQKPPEQNKENTLPSGSELQRLGGVLAYDIKQMLTIFGNFYDKMINFDFAKFAGMEDPKAQRSYLTAFERNMELPKIKDAKKLKTKLENPKSRDSLVAYLYRSIGVPLPKASEIKPTPKEVKLQHLTIQLKKAKTYVLEGPKSVMEKVKKNPPKFRKGDLMVFKKGVNGKNNAGLILAITDTDVIFQNNIMKPEKRPIKDIAFCFHFNGNTEIIPKQLST